MTKRYYSQGNWSLIQVNRQFKSQVFPHTLAGCQTLLTWMENHTREVADKLHCVRETNGIYHEGLAHALREAEIWVSVINPVHMRAKVKNMGNGLPGQAADVVTLIP